MEKTEIIEGLNENQINQIKILYNEFLKYINFDENTNPNHMLRLYIVVEACEKYNLPVACFFDLDKTNNTRTSLGGIVVYDINIMIALFSLITSCVQNKKIKPFNEICKQKIDPTCFNTNMKNSMIKFELSNHHTIYYCDHFKPSQREKQSHLKLNDFINTFCKRFCNIEKRKYENGNETYNENDNHNAKKIKINDIRGQVIIPANTVLITSTGTQFISSKHIFYNTNNKQGVLNEGLDFFDKKLREMKKLSPELLNNTFFPNNTDNMFNPSIYPDEYMKFAVKGDFNLTQSLATLVHTKKLFNEIYFKKNTGIVPFLNTIKKHDNVWKTDNINSCVDLTEIQPHSISTKNIWNHINNINDNSYQNNSQEYSNLSNNSDDDNKTKQKSKNSSFIMTSDGLFDPKQQKYIQYNNTPNENLSGKFIDPYIPYKFDESLLDNLRNSKIESVIEESLSNDDDKYSVENSVSYIKQPLSKNNYSDFFKLATDKKKLSKNFLQCVHRTTSDILYCTLNIIPTYDEKLERLQKNIKNNKNLLSNLIYTSRENKDIYEKHLKEIISVEELLKQSKVFYDTQKKTMFDSVFLRAFMNNTLSSLILKTDN